VGRKKTKVFFIYEVDYSTASGTVNKKEVFFEV